MSDIVLDDKQVAVEGGFELPSWVLPLVFFLIIQGGTVFIDWGRKDERLKKMEATIVLMSESMKELKVAVDGVGKDRFYRDEAVAAFKKIDLEQRVQDAEIKENRLGVQRNQVDIVRMGRQP